MSHFFSSSQLRTHFIFLCPSHKIRITDGDVCSNMWKSSIESQYFYNKLYVQWSRTEPYASCHLQRDWLVLMQSKKRKKQKKQNPSSNIRLSMCQVGQWGGGECNVIFVFKLRMWKSWMCRDVETQIIVSLPPEGVVWWRPHEFIHTSGQNSQLNNKQPSVFSMLSALGPRWVWQKRAPMRHIYQKSQFIIITHY